MGKINWGRVFLCGLLTGVVWYLLSALVFAFLGRDFTVVLFAASPPTFPQTMRSFYAFRFTTVFATGSWAIWLYAAIRPSYGPGPKTAALGGLAWWVIRVLVDVLWGSHRLIPLGALVGPLAVSLPTTIVAAVVGAWPYKE